jgi:glycosyltransferase involved in cell wall biosynthesis
MPRTLVVACDALHEVPEQLAELARNAGRRAELSGAGRAWAAEQWSWDATVRAYERIYYDVADDASRS